jgi:hypothetical protein
LRDYDDEIMQPMSYRYRMEQHKGRSFKGEGKNSFK